mmetsp:Transcript_21102/g.20267  ORF Transcript_21102/g.20267 Transcript_21102/m.20267 type:complete len:438 (-) Transcript_21102:166-1479(-)|eukprot:CAMPEP_0197832982 /NCGR_PEP_ID=MMETSP1437-20131217/17213_1 /TAXON_ID=49252 ORGANISM="Eucampia antarctica, Strain CCMP1452" /NCGR_SAMPLE_ID=MMETSP1437 /ASSEMBLY_ACC=CAM_ASM_001096 /LENGTH=437 /DNA_ID=CAMNT_0043436693 /DNA_START=48 /DNA_END=1361 /DNA_ORIENTATION=+
MAKFGITALAAFAVLGFTNAFAPSGHRSIDVSASTKLYSTLEAPPLAPLTLWGERIPDILAEQKALKKSGLEFAPTLNRSTLNIPAGDKEAQLAYAREHATEIKEQMEKCGAVVFREWDLMKTQEGFQEFYKAIGMKVCLDPLHSVSARPTVDGQKNSPVYEAVNKESRKNFFIGMHNEFVGTRAPRAAAFVCFKAAETGGEFLIADGRAIIRDIDSDVLERLYDRNIRYSVMELPFFGWIENLPDFMKPPVMGTLQSLAGAAINAKVDFDVDLLWGQGGYDNTRFLQARAPSQPPIVAHPMTGEASWFCNVHSHSSKLRKDREAVYGAERFEDGASQINKSDMYFGDDAVISDEDLTEMDRVTMKNVQYVKMTEGDVVLLDNYKCMHGRNVFDGTRKHGVAWFEGWEGEEEMKEKFANFKEESTSEKSFFAQLFGQ